MQNAHANVFTRPDTMLGVCQAIGEDLGFNPNWLRVALALPLVWQPVLMIGIYLGLGLLVLATRLLLPNPKLGPAAEPVAPPVEVVAEQEELPLAA